MPLDDDELRRQLALAEWYVQRGRFPTALILSREWLISLLFLRTDQQRPWLGHKRREHVEQRLNDLSERSKLKVASESEGELASLWAKITDLRNRFAHAGFDDKKGEVHKSDLAAILDRCTKLLSNDLIASLPQPTGGTLLLSPLGNSPGVLFTAVTLEQPARVVVVTSKVAQVKAVEALTEAGAAELPRQVLVMQDPYAGFGEAKSFLTTDLYRQFVNASKVVVNVTGGTTVMQHVVDALAREARRVGAPVQRVAMVDRRSASEQRDKAYVLGERVVLGSEESGVGDAE